MEFDLKRVLDFEKVREERSELLSSNYFNAHYTYSSVPVIFRGSFNKWAPGSEKWNHEFFKENFGHEFAFAKRTIDGKEEKKEFLIADYLDYMNYNQDEIPFYLNTQCHVDKPFKKAYQVPDFFNCWYGAWPSDNRKYDLSWLYFGAKGTFSKLHIDVWNSSAWNAVITGKKLWLFFFKDSGRSDLQRNGKSIQS
ncbi:hypothetical protein [Pedobacter lusitanus]|uniref:hypothetical protein n=1 Tax=Pedobacter lusitanus TaxID=1503925 RepID=UPI0006987B96|nr:hypothetical protein [Pedobacter lusitanus]